VHSTTREAIEAWSALQFLVEIDPNLGERPIEALAAANVNGAKRAVRAYLRVEEE
jgi:hypothetical protein